MIFSYILLTVIAFSFGLLAAAGVFTVFVAVGLIPRFCGKTHTAKKIFLYEDMVILGTIIGSYFSIFERYIHIGAWFYNLFPYAQDFWNIVGNGCLGFAGIFYGMFVGCLALAIAEMLDSIPIFTRRISFRHGLGCAILFM